MGAAMTHPVMSGTRPSMMRAAASTNSDALAIHQTIRFAQHARDRPDRRHSATT